MAAAATKGKTSKYLLAVQTAQVFQNPGVIQLGLAQVLHNPGVLQLGLIASSEIFKLFDPSVTSSNTPNSVAKGDVQTMSPRYYLQMDMA